MRKDAPQQIETWFADHEGDGEFGSFPNIHYSVIGPPANAARMIFATKCRVVETAIGDTAACSEIGMIGCHGLPSGKDIPGIRNVAREHELYFLGDMDPVDLLTFAWLRARLRPKAIAHLGVSDAYLAALRIEMPESFIIQCSPSELASLPLLHEVFPDLADTIGPNCAGLLRQGRKIEIEAVVSTLGSTEPIVRPVFGIDGKGRDKKDGGQEFQE